MELLEKDLIPLFSEAKLQSRIKEVAQEISDVYRNEELCVICVLKGSVMFMTDLVKHLKMPLNMNFIRLSSYGSGFTSTGKVNAVDISLPDLNDKNVLIVEDIIDTGLTAKFLMDFMKLNFKTRSTRFCSLLDKKITRQTQIEPD